MCFSRWLLSTSRRLAPIAFVGLLATSMTLPALGAAPDANSTCTYTEADDVPATMRDGTILRANVFTPNEPGTYGVVLMRLPYNKDGAEQFPNHGTYNTPAFYASHCFIVVIQDVRGQYKSDGTWYTFLNEANDGYDTVEWAAGLPKSNGKVGMYGFSYVGATQWLAATKRPPHLVAIIPGMTSADYHDGWTYEGGALDQSFVEDWPVGSIANSAVRRFPDGAALDAEMNQAKAEEMTKWYWYLPLITYPVLHPDDPRVAPYFYDWLRHPDNDAYWQQWSIRLRYGQITVPALNFEGWYDIFIDGGIENFNSMRKHGGSKVAREGQRLFVGPWAHMWNWGRNIGELDFGPAAENPIDGLMLRWWDYWLKGVPNGVDKEPKVRIFVMGTNKWRSADQFPLPGTVYRKFYLHSLGTANTATGDGWLSTTKPRSNADAPEESQRKASEAVIDHFTYDPSNPVLSIGGRFQDSVPWGPRDQSPLLGRPDVLVYTTPVLEKDTEVTGPITVTLYASSSATDTDFTAKVDDVYPDGRNMLIEYGIQRARYRESETSPTLIEPGKIYKYTIHVWPTSNVFKAGHRIRLEISSSNFPMYNRNPNTGHAFAQDADLQVAEQTIYHDIHHPSEVTLPIVETPLE